MKRIFIAAPHFPPSALPPSQRVRLLVRHLYEFGWEPVVFTVEHKYREELADPWMVEIAGDKFEKITVNAFDQRKTRKFGVGDLGIRMFIYLFFSLVKQARRQKPALILYPVPPWYIMVMAPFVKRITGIPYVIDFIDPWVHEAQKKDAKATISQWFARRMERFAVKNSDAIVAVSQGILNALLVRYPNIREKPLAPIPYGVEATDFQALKIERQDREAILLRYTGAISEAMLPVVDALFKALKIVRAARSIQVIFTGTSYAGGALVKPVLGELVTSNDVGSFVIENPARVGYREALELSLGADIQIVIGDTTPYYAASKLMGLAASGRPFFAFIHQDSFPASFLNELQYPYKTFFGAADLGTPAKIRELADAMIRAIREKDDFVKIDIGNPVLAQYTAMSMTKTFTDTFKKVIHE
jgi:hypothetical protein